MQCTVFSAPIGTVEKIEVPDCTVDNLEFVGVCSCTIKSDMHNKKPVVVLVLFLYI